MTEGLYEQLINKLIYSKIDELDKNHFYIKESALDKSEASKILSQYLNNIIHSALNYFTGDDSIEKQIELSNQIIRLLRDEVKKEEFEDDLIVTKGKILSAIFKKLDAKFSDFEKHLKEITPYSRLSHSELFTGSNKRI